MITEKVEIAELPHESIYNYLVLTTRHTFIFKTLKETIKFVGDYFSYNTKYR